MRVCPDCHAPVSDTANFCDNCGYPLKAAPESNLNANQVPPASASAQSKPPALDQQQASGPDVSSFRGTNALRGACSACGYINLPGEMFCQNCGVQLPPVASMPPPPPRPVSGPVAQLPIPQPVEPAPGETRLPPSSKMMPGRLVLRPNQQSISLPAAGGEAILGRSDPVKGVYPDVDLSPYGGDTSGVSRRHARLVLKGNTVYIEDLNSTNYTFLNHQKLTPSQLYPLKSGDELRLGLMVLEYIV
jgi:pSer/pThr/pTyr-binding forkhead associated (FHA) protein